MKIKHLSFSFLILFSFIIYTNANSSDCIYNIYVQTADIPLAGTSSSISIFLGDDSKDELPIVSLKDWGLMGSGHNYFSTGEIDLFAGKGPCLRGPICSLIIVLDGFDTWYCDSIEITTVGLGKSCSQKHFVVKKWLDLNKGSAVILQDECANVSDCVYNIYVQTGNIPLAGTSSDITIFLSDSTKAELPMVNLKDWGLMGSSRNYFSHGEVDLFARKGPCLREHVCSLVIVLDGFDSWYCDSIEVTTVGFGKSCSQKHFEVKKWLDANKGSAVILQDECDGDGDDDDSAPLTTLRNVILKTSKT